MHVSERFKEFSKATIESGKTTIESEKATVEVENSGSDEEGMQVAAFMEFVNQKVSLSAKNQSHIRQLYERFGEEQIFAEQICSL